MKAVIGGSKGGWWGKYVVEGTKNKPRDRDKIEILEGNIKQGERVTAQGRWTENEYTIVLGFKGRPPRENVRTAVKIFEKEFMSGFKKDEYHLDAVAHYDTNDTHVHIRIPKMNLLTQTQLQLYYHKKDVGRVNAIRDYINVKLNLDVSVNEKPLIAENADMLRIQKWRESEGRQAFDFSKKKGRSEAETVISDKIKREHQAGNINDLSDLKDLFSEHFVLDVVKKHRDKDLGSLSDIIKRTAFKITRVGELVGRTVATRLGVPFGIVDLSLAPTPAPGDSVADIIEAMGLERTGAPGTTAALALLTDAVKKGGAMATSYVGGLSGAFIPVSEDAGMVRSAREGALTLEKLESMTSVCSVGIDMVIIPGDTPPETISGIIADEVAIGVINTKTTAVRIIPAYGKKAGDTVSYGGLLGESVVMPVNSFRATDFILRGGRIPAPIQGMKN